MPVPSSHLAIRKFHLAPLVPDFSASTNMQSALASCLEGKVRFKYMVIFFGIWCVCVCVWGGAFESHVLLPQTLPPGTRKWPTLSRRQRLCHEIGWCRNSGCDDGCEGCYSFSKSLWVSGRDKFACFGLKQSYSHPTILQPGIYRGSTTGTYRSRDAELQYSRSSLSSTL